MEHHLISSPFVGQVPKVCVVRSPGSSMLSLNSGKRRRSIQGLLRLFHPFFWVVADISEFWHFLGFSSGSSKVKQIRTFGRWSTVSHLFCPATFFQGNWCIDVLRLLCDFGLFYRFCFIYRWLSVAVDCCYDCRILLILAQLAAFQSHLCHEAWAFQDCYRPAALLMPLDPSCFVSKVAEGLQGGLLHKPLLGMSSMEKVFGHLPPFELSLRSMLLWRGCIDSLDHPHLICW